MKENRDISIEIDGVGFILYSPYAVSHIKEDEDYLTHHYMTASQVADLVNTGSIVGIATGSSGTYDLKFRSGYPEEHVLDLSDFVLRLWIEVRDNRICIRDLYDLIEWSSDAPEHQIITLDNGYYHITVYSSLPESKIRGDDQKIYLYFNKLVSPPKFLYYGVPTFE